MTASENLEKLKKELYPTAKKHLKSIQWLIKETHPPKSRGRTWLLGLAFIEEALRNPGRKVYLFDHFPGPPENMKRSISYIFMQNPDLARNMQLGLDWLMLGDTTPYLVK